MSEKSGNLEKYFTAGFIAAHYSAPARTEPPVIQAYNHLHNLGFKPPHLRQGQLMRFPDAQDLEKGDTSGTAGWCIYNEHDGIGILTYGSWHGLPERETWCSENVDGLSNEQRQAYHDAVTAARLVAAREAAELKAQAIGQMQEIYDKLPPAGEGLPYLRRKGIQPHGAKVDDWNIVVPMYNIKGLCGLQYIDKDGGKRFKKHSSKGWFRIGTPDENAIFICEGFATGASLYEATGHCVYVAFDAGNLYNACVDVRTLHPDNRIVICADNDHGKDINTGLTKAQSVKDALGVDFIAPFDIKGTDFNDMALENGKAFLASYVSRALKGKKPEKKIDDKPLQQIEPPSGALASIISYYNQTSGTHQPDFAIQTALAIGSVICGRNFRTDADNYGALFFLNVGKTATGKEHCKTVIERVLREAGADKHVVGDGFTSSGGLMTELLRKPRIISVIDEFGMYMDAAKNKTSSNQKEANSYMMQAISRCHDVMRAKNYSAMSKGNQQDINDRFVYNPSLTLVGITTPSTFIDAISDKDIHSGFLNRFIVCVSDAKPSVRKRIEVLPVPFEILEWIMAIRKRAEATNKIEIASEPSKPAIIQISDAAYQIQRDFEQEMVDEIERMEPIGLDGLAGRANEQAMRISMIVALSRDPQAEMIMDADMIWATNYMRTRYKQLKAIVMGNITSSDFDAATKELHKFIERYGEEGASMRDISRSSLKRFKPKEIKDMLEQLLSAEVVQKIWGGNVAGRPVERYVSIIQPV